jgi:hypothetical protein
MEEAERHWVIAVQGKSIMEIKAIATNSRT